MAMRPNFARRHSHEAKDSTAVAENLYNIKHQRGGSINTRVCHSKERTNKYCSAEGEAHGWAVMPQGHRNCRRATVNGSRAKEQIDAMGHRPGQINLIKQVFFSQKATACGVSLNLRVNAIGHFQSVKTNGREV